MPRPENLIGTLIRKQHEQARRTVQALARRPTWIVQADGRIVRVRDVKGYPCAPVVEGRISRPLT